MDSYTYLSEMRNILVLSTLLLICQQHIGAQTDSLKAQIQKIIHARKADVGVAVCSFESPKDSLSINGYKPYPLMSVIKFFGALAVLHKIDQKKLSLDQKVHVNKEDLNPNTYSPMRDHKPKEGFEATVQELLIYSVGQSDNIAYLKLVDLLGGIQMVDDFIRNSGIQGVSLVSTYRDPLERVLQNTSTPMAANALLTAWYQGKILKKKSREVLLKIMLETGTGPDRLKGLLPVGTLVAHKTGTADWDEKTGIDMAFNDIGIVTLTRGKHYVVSVFITQSSEKDEENAKVIAEIGKACWDYFESK